MESLVHKIDLKTNLLHPLLPLLEERNRSLNKIAPLLPETGLHHCTDIETAAADLFQGRVVLFLDKETSALSFEFPGWAKHELKESKFEEAIHGPREGFTEKDDWLPPRFFNPKTSGALNKTAVDPEALQKAKILYYDMMGWTEGGVPKQSKLEELDIAWAVDKISKR